MMLSLRDGFLYVDNLRFCFAEQGNGRPELPAGRYEVTAQYAHVHGKTLPDAVGLGWIGADRGCDIVLGSVRGRSGVVPQESLVSRLVAVLEEAQNRGKIVMLEVE